MFVSVDADELPKACVASFFCEDALGAEKEQALVKTKIEMTTMFETIFLFIF